MAHAVEHQTDLLVVGAGPGGAAAAAWAARAGIEVLLIDSAVFPRDKTCGDGLTPRAVGEMQRLGMSDWLAKQPVSWGLRAHGFGQTLHLPWPGGSLPPYGSAAPRYELDAALRDTALRAGATPLSGARAVDVLRDGRRVDGVVVRTAEGLQTIRCRRLVVADGARSQLSRLLGRQWHQDTVYGVAARAYIASERADDPWISSHLELRGPDQELLSGYGWIFPLGGRRPERSVDELWQGRSASLAGGAVSEVPPGSGLVNIGVGTLATSRRPAKANLRELLGHYVDGRRDEFGLVGGPQARTSALLPMGGAVSGIAGENWLLVGDAAGGVNPLNGEGIDYALEMGRLAVDILLSGEDLSSAWPDLLCDRYGSPFSVARRLAGLLTIPGVLRLGGPVGMRSRSLMTIALRLMGNLMTEEDEDVVARLWRRAGEVSLSRDAGRPFLGPDDPRGRHSQPRRRPQPLVRFS